MIQNTTLHRILLDILILNIKDPIAMIQNATLLHDNIIHIVRYSHFEYPVSITMCTVQLSDKVEFIHILQFYHLV